MHRSIDSNRTRIQHCTRRGFLGTAAAATTVGVAGCTQILGGDGGDPFDSYGPQNQPVQSNAVSWDDLGDLEGTLTIYSERTSDQIDPLFVALEDEYDDFDVVTDYSDETTHLRQLEQEGENTAADLFYTQSSGDLAALSEMGLARDLPADVVDAVDDTASDPGGTWTGASGRVRAVQYNTDEFDAGDLPDDIFAYAEDDRFQGRISTRPNSGTFRSFITAMIELEGEAATRDWVRKMVDDQDVHLYSSGSQQAEAVANGDQAIALGNQYYAGRIVHARPDAPIDVAFTNDDAGCLFNVSGLAIPTGADKPNLAAEFVRHVLAREGQEFFVETNGEYPVVDGVPYVGDLPTLDEIEPPEFDLNLLGDVQHARDLLADEGMEV